MEKKVQKVLFCASTASHLKNFHMPYLKYFKDNGFEVHIAIPENEKLAYCDFVQVMKTKKNMLSISNLMAAFKLAKVLKNERYDLILTHTTLAGAVGRLALMIAGKRSTKLIHTVHGYLFWNGCNPVKKAILYFPEWILRGVTDCLITMNEEDMITAQKLVRKGGIVRKVPGMGVDPERFRIPTEEERALERERLRIPKAAKVLVYAAEFSKRKNHKELLKAFQGVLEKEPEAILLLCGEGALKDQMKELCVKLKIQDRVQFLGWCGNMEQIYWACDLAVSSSKSEGLPFNIIEAQMCGLPVVASRIRGHVDLIANKVDDRSYIIGNIIDLKEKILEILYGRLNCFAPTKYRECKALLYSLESAYKANVIMYEEIERI